MYSPYKDECLYIAGPECFYTGGDEILLAMRRRAESFGFLVSLPNDNPLKLDNVDLRLNADAIFENCAKSMLRTTAIVTDLETFRGTEPDGGSIFEIGMAYALGLRSYAYTRDARSMAHKYLGALLQEDVLFDLDGRVLPYQDLPFSPCVIGSTKITQGDFDDCLAMLMRDIDEERKLRAKRQVPAKPLDDAPTIGEKARPLVYLATPHRYGPDAVETYQTMKALCEQHGYDAVCPLDAAPGVELVESEDPYTRAYNLFDHWQQHVRNCDILVADLSDFHGWEPNSDVSFEAGMAWQLGKSCFGYMPDTTIMRQRIPHYENGRDWAGSNVENFAYPINLMFASSMPVLQGGFEDVLPQVAEAMKQG